MNIFLHFISFFCLFAYWSFEDEDDDDDQEMCDDDDDIESAYTQIIFLVFTFFQLTFVDEMNNDFQGNDDDNDMENLFREQFFTVINSSQLTFVDEVNNGSVSNGGRQLVPGLLYIDDKAPKYKVSS